MNKTHLIVGTILGALVVLVAVNAIIIPNLVMRSEPSVTIRDIVVPDAEPLDGSVPSCEFCETDIIKADEIAQYIEVAMASGLTDQQVRSLDIGRANMQVALAHRGPLSEPNPRSVAVHNLVTEVYVVLSGSGTNITGPDLVNAEPRPDDYRAVVYLNGPGQNAEAIAGGTEVVLEAGDVFVIPAGTGHQFTRIDDHITYLMIRIDPDKVVPLLDAAESQAYLEENL
jgi:mannose-6-phosphate isomerase-like protein (cupin superfamily)